MAPFEWKILYNLGIIHLTMQQYPLKVLSVIPFFLFTDKFEASQMQSNPAIRRPRYYMLVVLFHCVEHRQPINADSRH